MHTADGGTERVASWKAVPGKTMRLSAATASDVDDITDVEVRTAAGATVLELSYVQPRVTRFRAGRNHRQLAKAARNRSRKVSIRQTVASGRGAGRPASPSRRSAP